MGILSNGDIYVNETDPTEDINPKTAGAVWFNYSTGQHFICKDNTKDKNKWITSLDLIYPIGSCYFTMANIDPGDIFGGKWEKISGNQTIWLSDSGAGNTISPGLPNITGTCGIAMRWKNVGGAFYTIHTIDAIRNGGSYDPGIAFDASRSSSIYGNSTTVQPPAIRIYCWKRIA